MTIVIFAKKEEVLFTPHVTQLKDMVGMEMENKCFQQTVESIELGNITERNNGRKRI
jgi:hypothetical protein